MAVFLAGSALMLLVGNNNLSSMAEGKNIDPLPRKVLKEVQEPKLP